MSLYLLHITRGPNQGLSIPLSRFPVVVGREVAEGVSVEDSQTSRQHFQILRKNNIFFIEDLGSTNGTYLNGDRVMRAMFGERDRILIGSTEMMLRPTDVGKFKLSEDTPAYSSRWGQHLSFGERSPSSHKERQFYEEELSAPYHPQVVEMSSLIDSYMCSIGHGEKLFDYLGDYLVKDSLEDAGCTLLNHLGQNITGMRRGMFMLSSKKDLQLIPKAVHYLEEDPSPCWLHQRVLEDVMHQGKPLFLQAQAHKHPQKLHRLVIPMFIQGEIIALVHLEIDGEVNFDAVVVPQLSFCQAFLSRVSASIDRLILRSSIDAWTLSSVDALMTALEAKDTYTAGHSERVCRYSLAIAEELNCDRKTKQLLIISSLCHDVGKIGTPDHILKNSSMLTREEFEEIKHHPSIGDKIIKHWPNYHDIMGGVRHHHERRDGTGYPDGLVGDEIPFFGRIVAIADSFDAMVSGRSYSGFMEEGDAVEKLMCEVDVFDPDILKAFGRAYDNGSVSLDTGTQKRTIESLESA